MKDTLTSKDVTPKVIEAVAELLLRRVIAKVTRQDVDAVQHEVFKDFEFYNDLEVRLTAEYPRGNKIERKRITDPRRLYDSEDDEQVARYYAAVDAALRTRGFKPADMDPDHCPALVAEHEQVKAEWALLDAAAVMLGLDFDGQELNGRLLCEPNGKGLERRREFLDLLCKAVVNLPSTN